VHVLVKTAGAPTVDELIDVLDHAFAIGDENPELFAKLYRLVGWFTTQNKLLWTTDEKDRWRHWMVRQALDEGQRWITGGGAFQTVSDRLVNHPAWARADQIELSYKTVQAKLPPEQRRRRTYRPKSPLR
jgi:hypothetical protein